jgi:serine/threonine-protein kinase
VIAYEILTGEKPYTGEHLTTVVYKIVAEDFPAPHRLNPSLSGQIETVLRKGLAKKPDQRYRNCSEFIESLEKACTASAGWKPIARGGSLALPTVADVPKPLLPPSRKAQRAEAAAAASVASTDTSAKKRTGFVPFLMAILVAAGLLALIGWQAGPWIAEQTANTLSPPAVQEPAPPAGAPPATTPPVAQTQPPEEKKPSALTPEPQAPVPPDIPASEAEPEPTHKRVAANSSERPATGRTSPVTVVTNPAGASVAIDGQEACKSPCSVEAPLGRHTFAIRLPGHQTEIREVTVTRNPQELPLVTLRSASGTLMLTSSPTGAAVLINGKRTSYVTPAQILLAPGSYSIAIDKDGRQSTRTVEVKNGAINYLKLTME